MTRLSEASGQYSRIMVLLLYFLNGLHHGLGSDHVMAITTLAGRGAGNREVTGLGLKFGLGHMGALVFLGGAALLMNLTIPASWESRAEAFGGGLLVLLGFWTFVEWLREVGYVHSHHHTHGRRPKGHVHYHFHLQGHHPHQHAHPHFSTALGALFALSGLRSLLLGAVPILQARSLFWALIYILIFGLGIVTSMAACGWLAGAAAQRQGHGQAVTLLVSLFSVALGAYWIWAS